uniref:Uncharacterized protein n=1 Tax=Ombrophytum subterraneum TaxID=50155 RepID=A0A6M8PH33_9MAGN|nr:hypothetical protein [Ombrophytum subterraneum]
MCMTRTRTRTRRCLAELLHSVQGLPCQEIKSLLSVTSSSFPKTSFTPSRGIWSPLSGLVLLFCLQLYFKRSLSRKKKEKEYVNWLRPFSKASNLYCPHASHLGIFYKGLGDGDFFLAVLTSQIAYRKKVSQ